MSRRKFIGTIRKVKPGSYATRIVGDYVYFYKHAQGRGGVGPFSPEMCWTVVGKADDNCYRVLVDGQLLFSPAHQVRNHTVEI